MAIKTNSVGFGGGINANLKSVGLYSLATQRTLLNVLAN